MNKLSKLYFLFFTIIVVCGVLYSSIRVLVITPESAVLGRLTQLSEAQVLSLINLQRVQAGLTPLTNDDSLNRAARSKAQDLLQSGQWSHQVNGKTPWLYLDEVGYAYSLAGENLARNFSSNEAVITAWLASPSHAANILNAGYSQTGISIQQSPLNNNTIIVQLFAHPLDPASTVSPSYQITQAIQQDLTSARPLFISAGVVTLFLSFLGIIVVLSISFINTHRQFVPPAQLWRVDRGL